MHLMKTLTGKMCDKKYLCASLNLMKGKKSYRSAVCTYRQHPLPSPPFIISALGPLN